MKATTGLLLSVLLASAQVQAKDDTVERSRVLILLFDGVEIIDFAAPYEVFGQAGFTVRTVSQDGKPVTTAMKLRVTPDDSFETAQSADIIVVPGGDVQATSKHAATLDWIRRQSVPASAVLSVCTGSDILASTGLLDGQSATTFHGHFDHMSSMFPKVEVLRDQRWVDAGKIVTSAGLASGIDAALHVVAKLRGEKAARTAAMRLEYDWSPKQGFVRGLMADQFMRMPSPEPSFPEGTHFEKESSLGDSKYWEIVYRVKTPVTAEALIALLRGHAQADKALKLMQLPDPLQIAWEYEAERGGQWRLSLHATEIDSQQGFRLQAKVMRLR